MIPDWKDFLRNAGAEFDDLGVVHYGNPRRELSVALTGTAFADLSHYGLVSVHGEDAAEFLQAQFTNDLREVDESHSQFSGLCNAKGRLLADFRIFRHGDSYYLSLPVSMTETLLSRLRMFVLRSRVNLDEASDTFVHLGVAGPDAEEELAAAAGPLPADVDGMTADHDLIVIRVPGVHPSYELFTSVDKAMAIWDKLNVRCAPIGRDAWELQDIQAGVPVIYPQTSKAFVPQMVNLQLVDGVSFRKGCYPGQEVVARMQYLGKLKRRMYRCHVGGSRRPQPGDDIFRADDDSQSVGKVVSAAPHPDGGFELLAVIQIDSAEGGAALHVGDGQGPALEVGHLPYPFPDE
ncbi:MAG TPA: folate-binding protein [Gammaproteobacteria bacterium]|nr:folate-binding protein [Gammaproteobacteria bacterium]